MDEHPSVTLVAPILASGEDTVAAFAASFETECFLAAPITQQLALNYVAENDLRLPRSY